MARDIDVVLVGYRPGALHAASHLGLRVLLADEKEPTPAASRRIVRAVTLPLEGEPEAFAARVREALGRARPRAVVAAGERGVLAAAAVRADYRLGGIDPATAALARDKPSMKAAVRAAGIACTDWRPLDEHTEAGALVAGLGLPLVLKRRAGAGTSGLMVSRSLEDAVRDLATIPAAERGSWMGERFVHGPEMSVESFVHEGRILLANPTEYYIPGFASIAPAALDPAEADAIFTLNAAALDALGLRRGMTHLELYRTSEGPVFGEVAVRPPGGRLMRLLRRAYGFDPWDAVVRLELGQGLGAIAAGATCVAGAWMLHPGPGRVVSARGFAAARRVKGVRKLVCRTRAGRVLAPRTSTGSDVGWLEVSGRSRDEVVERLEEAFGKIHFEMA